MPSNLRGIRFPDEPIKKISPTKKAGLALLGLLAALFSQAVLAFVIAVLVAVGAYNYAVREFVPSLPAVSILNGFVLAAGLRALRFLVVK